MHWGRLALLLSGNKCPVASNARAKFTISGWAAQPTVLWRLNCTGGGWHGSVGMHGSVGAKAKFIAPAPI
jgi:hypothetical protein